MIFFKFKSTCNGDRNSFYCPNVTTCETVYAIKTIIYAITVFAIKKINTAGSTGTEFGQS